MSSACVCHTDEGFCFYCEIHSPLERKHAKQFQAIERVIADLKTRRQIYNHHKNHEGAGAFLYAITSLEEVLSTDDNETRSNTRPTNETTSS